MNKRRKESFMRNLVELLLNYEEDENDRIIIERQTFQQVLLYILMEEVLVTHPEDTNATLFQEVMLATQKEFEEILHLLKRVG